MRGGHEAVSLLGGVLRAVGRVAPGPRNHIYGGALRFRDWLLEHALVDPARLTNRKDSVHAKHRLRLARASNADLDFESEPQLRRQLVSWGYGSVQARIVWESYRATRRRALRRKNNA